MSSHLSSWSLVLRAGRGLDADGDVFVRRYEPVLRAYFAARWRLPFEHEQVQDATQEFFVRCFRPNGALSRADRQQGSSVRAFLYGVAKHIALDIERKARRRKVQTAHSAVLLDSIEHSEETLSCAFDRAWAQMLVEESLLLMRQRHEGHSEDPCFPALILRFCEDLPPREIATRLEIRVESVYELLRRGKKEFRAALLEVMAEHNPEASMTELKEKCIALGELV